MQLGGREGGVAPYGHLESPGLQCWWVQESSSRGPVMVAQWSKSKAKLHAELGKRLCLVSLPILQDQGWTQKDCNHHHSYSGHF